MNSLKNFVNFAFLNQKVNVIANLFDHSKNQQSRDQSVYENRIHDVINHLQNSTETSQ